MECCRQIGKFFILASSSIAERVDFYESTIFLNDFCDLLFRDCFMIFIFPQIPE